MLVTKDLIQAFTAWLASDAVAASVEDPDNLEIATESLAAAFGFTEFETPVPLDEFSQKLVEFQESFNGSPAPSAPQKEEETFVELRPEEEDARFERFLKTLEDKGAFASAPYGSAAFNDLYSKAKMKFELKYGPAVQKDDMTAKSLGDEHKKSGNGFLQSGDYQAAVQEYTLAIEAYPHCAIYYANRAAALSHISKDNEAISDCEAAIKIDPNYVKSYSRLGLAYFNIGKFNESITLGYQPCLDRDPTNMVAQEGLSAAKAKLKETAQPCNDTAGNFKTEVEEMNSSDEEPEEIPNSNANAENPFANFGAGGAGGAPGGMPDLSSMFGGGGMPDLGNLMNNPNLMGMAQQMMQNPEMMRMAQNMMGGMGGGQ